MVLETQYLSRDVTYLILNTVLYTTVGPLNFYKKSEGQIM